MTNFAILTVLLFTIVGALGLVAHYCDPTRAEQAARRQAIAEHPASGRRAA